MVSTGQHHHRSIRLKAYDYTQEGAYYFTICCHQRRCLLGEINDGVIHLNLIGATVKAVLSFGSAIKNECFYGSPIFY